MSNEPLEYYSNALVKDNSLKATEVSEKDISFDDHIKALKWMWRSRYLNEYANTLQRNGGLYIWPSSVGQEAAQVGLMLALSESDYIFPTYREHIIPLMRGVSVQQLLSIFSGESKGGWIPDHHNCHINTLVLGSQVLHSTGFAMSDARRRSPAEPPRTIVTFLGDGASSQGSVHEGFVFAASYLTSQLFVIQDNGWAISTPSHVQSRVPLVQRGFGYGMTSVEVDGNDLNAVYKSTFEALQRSRDQGPQLLVLKTYRVEGHTTSDNPSRYRSSVEVETWMNLKDPIIRAENYLRKCTTEENITNIRSCAMEWVDDKFGSLYVGDSK